MIWYSAKYYNSTEYPMVVERFRQRMGMAGVGIQIRIEKNVCDTMKWLESAASVKRMKTMVSLTVASVDDADMPCDMPIWTAFVRYTFRILLLHRICFCSLGNWHHYGIFGEHFEQCNNASNVQNAIDVVLFLIHKWHKRCNRWAWATQLLF